MAQFRILSGVSTALPAASAQTEGTVFYTHDNSLFHIDYKAANGNFVRKTLNAEQAKKLMEARTITLSGDVSGSVSFDGSQNVVIETKVADTFASKDDVNSLDILLSASIDKKADKSYVDEELSKIDINLMTVSYENMITVASPGQTTFSTGIETFDPKNDALEVHQGRLFLTRGEDYTISGSSVVLNEAPEVGETLTFSVLKNVPALEDEITITSSMLEDGSIPLSKLQSMPTATQVGTYTKAEIDALIAQAVNAAKAEIMASLTVTSDIPTVFGITDDGGLSVTYDDQAVNA